MLLDGDTLCGLNQSEILMKINKLDIGTFRRILQIWLENFPPTKIDSEHYEELSKFGLRALGQLVVTELWPSGFNLFQLAQLDVSAVILDKVTLEWVASGTRDKDGEPVKIPINFKRFENGLKSLIGKLHDCHVYSERHPVLPLVICRVQLFECNTSRLMSHKPFYVAIPTGYRVLYHSAQKDVHSQYILQCLLILLRKDSAVVQLNQISPAIRGTLTDVNMRYGACFGRDLQGVWTAYLDKNIEPSPLDSPEKHPSVVGVPAKRRPTDDDDENVKWKQERSMIMFKGSKYGIKRKKKYLNKRSQQRIYRLHGDNKENNNSDDDSVDEYESLIPVRNVSFSVKDNERGLNFKLRLQGNDVFGGLHELCSKQQLDIDYLPSWLTGEHGDSSGIVEDGKFKKLNRAGII
ncbi:HHL193Wp [Eremothecium sinecaudum]|uniref:HHL193Wp n=1 Tax=Eremothecium sinecaudum TaxID=45286 RepID=A0A120K2T9_9SACH|nr:HHL193Wp [Eremothecium sinecaudum]AMD22577.1 HHL193Wp [Eremothecium sinecaudum]